MPERTPILAANWKMHKTIAEAGRFLDEFLPRVPKAGPGVVLCPPYLALQLVAERCADSPVRVAAQNMHEAASGAFTGEVSAPMLVELGVDGVILGHSERRQHFGETDDALSRKVPAALAAGLQPILCVGESLEQREEGRMREVLSEQVSADLAQVEAEGIERLVIAYEPVWAIGTGRTATPEQAQEAIALIRQLLADRHPEGAERARILYGGSVKPDNAAKLISQPDVDGALVGGASLDPSDFAAIVSAAA